MRGWLLCLVVGGVTCAAVGCDSEPVADDPAADAGGSSTGGAPSGGSSGTDTDGASSGGSSSGDASSSSSSSGGSSSSSSSGGPSGHGVEGAPCSLVGERYEIECGECGVRTAYCTAERIVSGYGSCQEPAGGCGSSSSSSSGGSSSSSGGSSSGGQEPPPECDDGATRCHQFGEQVCVDRRWQDREGEACCVDPNPNRYVDAGGDWRTDTVSGAQFSRQLERAPTGSGADGLCYGEHASRLISRDALLRLALPEAEACTPALDHSLFLGRPQLGARDPLLHDVFFVRPASNLLPYECVSTRTGETVPCGDEANVLCGG